MGAASVGGMPATADPPDLEAWCRSVCLDLPDATVDQPFGPGADVLRIHRKMFALLTHNPRVSEHPIVNLKAEPHEVPLLIGGYDFVRPGFHMNKKHWITVELGPDADLVLVAELIEDSYDTVVAGLPARLRTPLVSLRGLPATGWSVGLLEDDPLGVVAERERRPGQLERG